MFLNYEFGKWTNRGNTCDYLATGPKITEDVSNAPSRYLSDLIIDYRKKYQQPVEADMEVLQVGYDVKVNCAGNTRYIRLQRKKRTCSTFNSQNQSKVVLVLRVQGIRQHANLRDSPHAHEKR